MLAKITIAEEYLDQLLPKRRIAHSVPADLFLAAKRWSAKVWADAEREGPIVLADEEIEKGLKLIQSPVFICGVHRSGTTLVRDLLDAHSELVVLPSEGTYYTNLEAKLIKLSEKDRPALIGKEWLRRLANPINQEPYWLLGRSTVTVSPYVNFARYLMAWWREPGVDAQTAVVLAYASVTDNLSAKFWVDKTPTNERFLKRIWQEMPNSRIIHVIREPMATLASRKKMEPGVKLRVALADLKRSFQVATDRCAIKDDRFLLVRYEQLCRDPQSFKDEIAAFLGIVASNSLNRPTVAGIPARANSSFNVRDDAGRIFKPSHHKYKSLRSAEKRYISANIGHLAHKLGYTLVSVNLWKRLLLKLKYRVWRS